MGTPPILAYEYLLVLLLPLMDCLNLLIISVCLFIIFVMTLFWCRQLSGANIKIAGAEEGSMERTITITGIPEAINAAQYLINARLVEWSYKGYI